MAGNPSDWPRLDSVSITAVAVLVVCSSIAVGGAAAQHTPLDADNTVTRIQVRGTGDATWTIQVRIRLETEEQVADFEAFSAHFQRNRSRYLDPFRERIRATVNSAANATGRQMSAVNFTASTAIQEVPRRWGVVTFRFTWNGFAETPDDTLVVGDVFQGGFFLAAGDSLEITVIDGYEATAVEPVPDEREDGMVVWFGREDFSTERPHVVFTVAEPGARTATDSTGASSTGGGLIPGRIGEVAILLGGVLLVGLGVGIYALRRWGRGGIGGTLATRLGAVSPARSGTDRPEASAAGGEILTDAERVQQLLEARGGRMKQATIADELGWSASKVSRIVGDMAEDGTVEKLQLGRENLVEIAEDT